MAEQRYQAVLAVIGEGGTVTEVPGRWGVSRQSVHGWLSRYERAGLEGLADRSHRPASCPHQMPPEVEAVVLEMRRVHRSWGARRIAFELGRLGAGPVPSGSGIYRALVRAGLIESGARRRRKEEWRRWERGSPMELWQMDVVGGFLLADGSHAKALTGIDDHSRFCVCAGADGLRADPAGVMRWVRRYPGARAASVRFRPAARFLTSANAAVRDRVTHLAGDARKARVGLSVSGRR